MSCAGSGDSPSRFAGRAVVARTERMMERIVLAYMVQRKKKKKDSTRLLVESDKKDSYRKVKMK